MRTKKHWDECLFSLSYETAQHMAFELKEFAKQAGFNPNGIKVLSKKQIHKYVKADAAIMWGEGPECWANSLLFKDLLGVYVSTYKGNTILFHDR
ncbi:hypothetical protein RVBP17_1710 [Pseudomonas phage sp. 30-3]|uniref:Uncharacterized protein n=1 Tax=Pseudomonas phage vB_PaeM_PA5oct TaxID=2163605 RepID=A0A4Y5JXX9_9CAUD|nr:hypothetical protein PQE65_gp222 [Pseudomonas phage vB_PaeM_PA5oct]WMI31806.1 hypothetical protein GBBBJNDB_00103 [Pseudomonas phage Callisto]WPK38736.1 hypothetical protein Cassandra_0060 [Pseudomonas phage Cassandra]WPK39257.1 hypothetical protein Deiofobo_0060 [Pseudomonas phage Deifobo]WPK39769.1 hypothetical protein ETTORE_0060 [Pseudomonas phage Ettore]WPK40290.1 hypothetical protein Paride_0060 [Pseudomonas phage Paride]VOH54119.1 hypothetical protein MIJ3_00103 [Pseudomonas phage v